MKRLFFAALVCSLTVISINPLFAQDNKPSPEEHQERMKQHLEQEIQTLNLSDQQKEEYREVSRKYGEQFRTLHQSDMEKSSKHAKMKSLIEQKNTEMQSLLSKEQYTSYLDIQHNRKEKMKERRKF